MLAPLPADSGCELPSSGQASSGKQYECKLLRTNITKVFMLLFLCLILKLQVCKAQFKKKSVFKHHFAE